MNPAALDALFRPGSIAVVGASATVNKIGGIPVDFLRQFGYRGRVLPVNPRAAEIQGLPAYARLTDIGEPVDCAIFAVPSSLVESALEDAIRAGVKSVVLFSSGYAEVGGDGVAAQARLSARARDAGIRIIGPNCLGVMNPALGVYSTFSPAPRGGLVAPGRIGLVSQSGAFGAYAYAIARERGIGLSVWASTGNEADVQFADVVAWMARDPATSVIMGYMEGCRDGDRLREALALAHDAGKPVVIVKVGRTALGAHAAASHTAALAGDDAVYDTIFRQYGVYRARDIGDFFDAAHAAVVAGLPRNDSLAIFTVSGGVGAFMADEASTLGLDVRELPAEAQRRILDLVPFAATRNPVDITGQITNDTSLIETAARICLDSTDYGSWIGFMAAAGANDAFWPVLQQAVASLRAAHPEVVLTISTLLGAERRKWLADHGCLAFSEPADAVRTTAALVQLAAAMKRPVPPILAHCDAPSLAVAPGALDEPGSLALLAAAGIPVVSHRVVRSADEAAREFATLAGGSRAAVKVVSQDLLHKSDIGGVALGVDSADAARRAFDAVTGNAARARPDARIGGALLAPMVAGGVECMLGARIDPVFGPVVVFGLGGAFVEVLRDVAIRVAPIDRGEALAMIREVRAFPLLNGARGRPPCDLDALVSALVALSDLAMKARGTLDSIDVNPFLAFPPGAGPGGGSALALDAVVIGTEPR